MYGQNIPQPVVPILRPPTHTDIDEKRRLEEYRKAQPADAPIANNSLHPIIPTVIDEKLFQIG